MMLMPYVVQLLAGKVKRMGMPNAADPMDRQWESGMFKTGVDGSVWLGQTGLSDDEVADTINHGGSEKALFAYPLAHYDEWKKEPELQSIGIGSMGENLAIINMDEDSVCVGDTYQFGDAVIQVSQPRQPCWKPARRFRKIDFAVRIQDSGRTGWYFRILKEGLVHDKVELLLLERPYPEWTISKCNEVMHVKKDDLKLAEELASCELLAEKWKKTLNKRLAGENTPIDKRAYGPNSE